MVKLKYILIYIFVSITLIGVYYIYSNISLIDIKQDKDQNRFFEYLELKTLDTRFKIRGVNKSPKDVVIIGIDERSLTKIGKWPWRRDVHAKLIDVLTLNKVKAVGFDISFTEAAVNKDMEEYRSGLKSTVLNMYRENRIEKDVALELAKTIVAQTVDEDSVFGESIKNAGNISIGTYNMEKNDDSLLNSVMDNITYRKSHYSMVDGVVPAMKFMLFSGERSFSPFTVYKIIPPIEKIGEYCYGVASYEVGKPEIDGNVRKIPAVVMEEATQAYFAPMYFMVYLNSQGYTIDKNVVLNISDSKIEIYKNGPEKIGKIMTISTDKNGYQGLNYYGPKETFKYLSYLDVLEGKVDKKDLEGKIVLVGYTDTAKGLYDMRATPFDPNMAGIEIHATAIQNIIDNNFMKRFDVWQNVILMFIVLFTMVAFFSIKKINFIVKNIAALLIIVLYAVAAQLVLNNGVWIDLFYPVFSLFMLYLVTTITNYYGEEAEKKKIKHAFEHYSNPELIKQLMKNPDKLKLGGERKCLTVLFTDIAGFTSISENMEPEKLVEFLNEYLTAMTDIILKNNGMIDKYEGDAIMAVFGAPVYYDKHAEMACITAIEYQKKLDSLRESWKERGLPELRARIGINTGDMIVGNMGSNKKFDYTVMGDSVNLASRLEGANKLYKTEIMISSDTCDALGGKFEVRKLDTIRVKGKKKPVEIYELIGHKGEIDVSMDTMLKDYNGAMEKYQNRDWDNAEKIFKNIFDKYNGDGPSKVYLERCIYFKENPPADDWDGVYTFTTK